MIVYCIRCFIFALYFIRLCTTADPSEPALDSPVIEDSLCVDNARDNTEERSFQMNDPMELDCRVPNRTARTKYKWFYNCKDRIPKNAFLRHNGYTLVVSKATFTENPGLYSCMKEEDRSHKFRKLHFKVCLQPPRIESIVLSCSNIRSHVGDRVQVPCDVVGSSGYFDPFDISATITRVADDKTCTTYVDLENEMQSTNNSCSLTIKSLKDEQICFGDASMPPTDDQLEAGKLQLQLTYEIRELDSSDVGDYIVTIDPNLARTFSTNLSIILEDDAQSRLHRSMTITICFISLIVLSVMLSVLVKCYFSLEFRWICWKMLQFGRKYDIEVETFLAYQYSTMMTSKSSSTLKSLVFTLTDYVEKRGGVICDGNREPCIGECKPRMVMDNLENCQRVVIIVTPEYLQEEWRIFELLQACKCRIENERMKFLCIYITTSGCTNSDSKEQESAEKLRQILKPHPHEDVIWDGKVPFSRRMRFQLDLFLLDDTPLSCDVSRICHKIC